MTDLAFKIGGCSGGLARKNNQYLTKVLLRFTTVANCIYHCIYSLDGSSA